MIAMQRRRDAAYVGLVKSLLESRDFYFSYTMVTFLPFSLSPLAVTRPPIEIK